MKHVISIDDFDPEFIAWIVRRATEIKRLRLRQEEPYRFFRDLHYRFRGRLMITDFFEPSTRTRFSFEAAMAYLGGMVIGSENAAEFSSFKKGESLEDNFRVISGYGDIIVGRFLHEGDARRAADVSEIPLINGGDGMGEHPTQALIDYFSIFEHFPKLQTPLKVVFFGDNLRSRTVHSLAMLLSTSPSVGEIIFLSPPRLKPDEVFLKTIEKRADHGNVQVWSADEQDSDLQLLREYVGKNVLLGADVVYVTRSQDERGGKEAGLVFAREYLNFLSPESIILHPLPRNSELPTTIDNDPRACYFEQSKNGLYVRMALLENLLTGTDR